MTERDRRTVANCRRRLRRYGFRLLKMPDRLTPLGFGCGYLLEGPDGRTVAGGKYTLSPAQVQALTDSICVRVK